MIDNMLLILVDFGDRDEVTSNNRNNGSRDTTKPCSCSRNADCEVKRPPFLVRTAPIASVSDSFYIIRGMQTII